MRTLLAVFILLLAGLAGCSDAPSGDTDRDGLYDAEEEAGWVIYIDLMGRRISREVNSDPTKQDTDGDGVPDPIEFAIGLDPRDKDTDDDGLTDCQEVMHTNVQQCEDDDWEGLTDGGYKTIASRADSDPFPSRYAVDYIGMVDETGTWDGQIYGDGISDGEEVMGYEIQLSDGRTRFITSDPLKVDTDGDVLQDGEERFLYSADPTNADTDGDGCRDGLDPLPARAEAFDLGLESITWNRSGASGHIDVRLLMHLVDNGFAHPTEGALRLQHGAAADLSSLDLGPFNQAQCSFPPWHPWIRLSVQVVQIEDGEATRGLDFHSDTVPNDTASAWWNVQDGSFTYVDPWPAKDFQGTGIFQAQGGVLSWTGPDGSVRLQPQIVDAS